MSNITFVGGIHGVGKGAVCRRIISLINVEHFTASDLIKWSELSLSKNKLVSNISSTQDRLIKGLDVFISKDKEYLLDGHYCLLNSTGNPERIPEETFYAINPKIIAVVTEEVRVIIDRLQNRDDTLYSYSILENMQLMEIEYSYELSKKLNVPFIEVKNGNETELIKNIKSI